MTEKSATKERLIDRGVTVPHARQLSLDRRIEDVEAMDIDSIATALSVPVNAAAEIHRSIHHSCPSLAIRSKFSGLLCNLHLGAVDHISNLTGDSNRFDVAALWSKHSGQPCPISFNDLSNADEETIPEILHLLHLEFGFSPSFASSLVFVIDRTDLIVTRFEFHNDTLSDVATEIAALDLDHPIITPDDAEFLGLHADLLPPNKDRDLQKGDMVAYYGTKTAVKSMKYRSRSCGSKSNNPSKEYLWPSSRWDMLGQVTYCYSWSDFFDIMFEDGTEVKIHKDHMVRIICSSPNGGWSF